MTFRAVITAKATVSGRRRYAWKEQGASYTTGADLDPLGYRRGTTTITPAVEINDREVDVGALVLLRERGFVGGQMWYEFSATGGTGDVSYAANAPVAADNGIPRFDGTTGKLIQGSAWTIDDQGTMQAAHPSIPTALTFIQPGQSMRFGNSLGTYDIALFSGAATGLYFNSGTAYITAGTGGIGATMPVTGHFIIGGNNTISANFNDVCFAVGRTLSVGGAYVVRVGQNGALPDGSVVTGGIITTIGTGTFMTNPGNGLSAGSYP